MMPLRATMLAGLLLALAAGCGPERPASGATSQKQAALASARALAKRAAALHAPVYKGPDDRSDKGEFLAGPLRQWVVERMKLHRPALAAYRDAVDEAADASGKLVALDEMGEMELSLADEFVAAGLRAMPGEYRNDKAMAETFEQALQGAVAPRVESARKSFKACQSLARSAKLSTPAAARCSDKLAAMPPPVPADAVPAQPRSPSAAGLPVPERPLVASTQRTPCVLSGTLRSFAELEDGNGEPIGVVDPSPGVELTSLQLPAQKADPMRVSVSWPIVFSGTLSHGSLPLVTRQRLDLVKGHIWLDKGARVTAFHPAGGRAIAYRDFRDGRADSKTEPAELSHTVACSTLALDQDQAPDPDPADADKRVFLAGLVPLYAAPKGRRIGKIEVPQRIVERAMLVERRGDSAHVRGRHGFSFDAWVPASALVDGGIGLGGIGRGLYTHVAQGEIPLRLSPRASAPVVAKLSKGADVLVGALISGFVPIRVAGVFAHNRSRAFYLDARDLGRLAPGKPDRGSP